MKSRRTLDPETARRMVRIREARRAIQGARDNAPRQRAAGTSPDTTAAIQGIQDALWLRLTPAEKLAQVAGLAAMFEMLALEGLRMRHPADDAADIRYRRAEMRLGKELAARVYRPGRGVA